MNDVSKSIGWADFTFNPITGCKRGCPYCYARRIHTRFNDVSFSEISYHPSRMADLEKLGRIRKPKRIFVGSMSDIEYWPKDITQHILNEIARYHRHTFMFLSKSPLSYMGFVWPSNTMQGLTCTLEEDHLTQMKKMVTMILHSPDPFLSFEPILGTLKVYKPMHLFRQIIVGAMTGPGAVKPKPEWIQSVKDNCPVGMIYWKKNIQKYL